MFRRVLNHPDGDLGADAKYSVTQSLTADLTYNTDFAQVEADEQQVNLTRFSLFFPEKRDFFLENQGIFTFGGAGGATGGSTGGDAGETPLLFYSRRIGLNGTRVVPILGGGRLTGRVGRTTLGLINMETRQDRFASTPGTFSITPAGNFSVVRIKRDISNEVEEDAQHRHVLLAAGGDRARAARREWWRRRRRWRSTCRCRCPIPPTTWTTPTCAWSSTARFAEEPEREMLAELADRFGPPPPAVETLVEVAALKRLAESLRVQSISAKRGELIIRLRRDARIDVERLIEMVSTLPGRELQPHRGADPARRRRPAARGHGARDAGVAGAMMRALRDDRAPRLRASSC